MKEFDPNLVIMSQSTMQMHLGVMLFPARMAALLLAVSGGLGLLLAAVGLYGVVLEEIEKMGRTFVIV